MKNFPFKTSPLCFVSPKDNTIFSYPFVKTEGGKELSSTPKQKNDCSIRALVLVTGRPYDEIYSFLKPLGRDYNEGLANDTLRELMGRGCFGYSFQWIFFKAIKGESRMNPIKFCRDFKEGTYLLNIAGHVSTCIDGIIYDSFYQRPDRCIYGAWKVIKNEREN
jgi:hypothetical protein